MRVELIVAVDENNGIGKNNDLLWHLPDDLKFFKQQTTGHIVIMGRKNYESIPEKYRPLPNRENVVLTRNASYRAEGCKVFHSLEECLDFYKNEEDRIVFITGGGEIYKQSIEQDLVDQMYITTVHATYDADTFFPEIDASTWKSEIVLEHPEDEKHEAAFTVRKYTRTTSK